MIILGIDPGTATAGYGIVNFFAGELSLVAYGVIETPAGMKLPERLLKIYRETRALIEAHRPDVAAVEQLFFSRNVTTAFSVGQARGVFLLAAAEHGLEVVEYGPHEVKQAVTGEGRASKEQVAFMVRALLGMKETPRPDDAADALAIAICHAHTTRTRSRVEAVMRRADGGKMR